MYSPEQILDQSIDKGTKKVKKSILAKLLLGFIGGVMIAMGFLADIRVSASIPTNLASIGALIGAAVFPIGLIVILLAGGELVTGNMMAVSAAMYDSKVSVVDYIKNLLVITLGNIIGAICIAYFLGHFVGLTHIGVFRDAVINMATSKVASPFWQSFVSGIGCNWFVGIAVWLSFGAKDGAGKILGIWFPIMIFVAIGLQHSIANAFLLPAAIFEGGLTWFDFIKNIVPVYLGNIVGGSIFVSGLYYLSYRR
ncbi:formate/nitrite transporter family protein [Companilactobacillus keshanensis]|uniref:Formate/nitrite transporter family protein n=1 Tax=Companilactobacillus keshanensis TaxID=2486003 RepID=A0ABW4BUN7_9LACO|nr:formate/nitrite transporter family protein [Companilactobacillus keshanensis]